MESPATENLLDRITPREREALRAFFVEGHRGAAAASLNISESTLKTHLASARAKLAIGDRAIVGLLFPERNGPHPRWTSPDRTMGSANLPGDVEPIAPAIGSATPTGRLADSNFVADVGFKPTSARQRNRLNSLSRLVLILVMMFVIIAMIVLAVPLGEGLQRWANLIVSLTGK